MIDRTKMHWILCISVCICVSVEEIEGLLPLKTINVLESQFDLTRVAIFCSNCSRKSHLKNYGSLNHCPIKLSSNPGEIRSTSLNGSVILFQDLDIDYEQAFKNVPGIKLSAVPGVTHTIILIGNPGHLKQSGNRIRAEINQAIYFYDLNTNCIYEHYFVHKVEVKQEIGCFQLESSKYIPKTEQTMLIRRENFQGIQLRVLQNFQTPYLFKEDIKAYYGFDSTCKIC